MAHMGEFWFFVGIPFLIGLATGSAVPRGGLRNFYLAILFAPVISGSIVCVTLFIWDVHDRYDPSVSDLIPVILRSIIATLGYSSGIFMFGALPAIAGCALVQWLKAKHP